MLGESMHIKELYKRIFISGIVFIILGSISIMFVYGFGEYTPEYVVPKMLPIVYFIQGLLAFIIY